MAYAHYDRLTAFDATFLEIEDENVHMHVGAISIFEGGELLREDGSLDFARVRRMAGPALGRKRRFRQRLGRVPVLGHPVWVDDERFNLDYHLRHTALPEPGSDRQLKRLFGRVMSQKLDEHKPLWEMWFVEGLERGRFAVITKAHHCMIDGISGVDLLATLMDPAVEADARRAEEEGASPRWLPRPAPTPLGLLADEARRRAALPLDLVRAGLGAVAHPAGSLDAMRDAADSLREFLAPGLAPGSRTPLNVDIGPHRRFDWLRMDLGEVKEIKNRLGGTVNDVVLTIVAGAVRSFLEGRGVPVRDLLFRAQVPVNIRGADEAGALGNRVAIMLAELPVAEPDPRKRHEAVLATMQHLKGAHQARGAELLERLGDWTAKEVLGTIANLTARQMAFNIVVTNVPGPQFAVKLFGARMTDVYPLVPLFTNQALGIALFSYDGGLFWGLNADWDAMPDLHDFVTALEQALATLRAL